MCWGFEKINLKMSIFKISWVITNIKNIDYFTIVLISTKEKKLWWKFDFEHIYFKIETKSMNNNKPFIFVVVVVVDSIQSELKFIRNILNKKKYNKRMRKKLYIWH